MSGTERGDYDTRVAYWQDNSGEKAPSGAETVPSALRAGVCTQSAGDFVVELFAGTFSAAVPCITVFRYQFFVGCEKNLESFRMAKEYLLRQPGKAAFHTSTELNLSK